MNNFIELGGLPVSDVSLKMGEHGTWTADVRLFEESDLTGATTLRINEGEYPCFIQTSREYRFAQHLVVTGGRGNVLQVLSSKSYRSLGGVNPLDVIKDILEESGNQLGAYTPFPLHTSYTRDAGTVGECLTSLGNWYVGLTGEINFGARPTQKFEYLVAEIDPHEEVLKIPIDDLGTIQPGYVIDIEGESYTAREVHYSFEGEGESGFAVVQARSTLLERLQSLVNLGAPLHGVYSYIVEAIEGGGRVGLRRNSDNATLPDFLPIEVFPGIPGAKAKPLVGTECLVSFVDGRRDRPVVTNFAGSGAGNPVATKGGVVKVYLGILPITGLINGVENFVGTLAAPTSVLGVIQGGSTQLDLEE